MSESVFALNAPALLFRGYNPIPLMPGSKSPGVRTRHEGWRPMAGWDRWCRQRPTERTIAAWLRMIGDSEAGVGVACGMGLICIDIDLEDAMEAILAILPPSNVTKKGRKGISLFYRGNTDKIRSRNFRTPDKIGLLDLLSEGKQTVLPPSIHPDTGEPYYWCTEETLANTWPEDLTELPDDIAERIGEALKAFSYDPDSERPPSRLTTPATDALSAAGASNLWRETNDRALAHLDCWVPALGLFRCRTKPGGYCAVASWRESGTGRPREVRKRNLSIDRRGIADFGDGRTYTPIDLVMAARNLNKFSASNWLLEHLPNEQPLIILRSRKN